MKVTITFPDKSKKSFSKGITAMDIAKSISEGLARNCVAVLINNELKDMSVKLNKNATVKLLTFNDAQGKEIFWHSSAHILAHAIKRLFPKALPTIGPAIDEGFYYDFDKLTVDEKDIEKIEAEVKKIAKENFEPVRTNYKTKAAAKKVFKNNKYKMEMIDKHEVGLSAYEQADFIDLCKGPHIPRTGMIKAFKITKLASAYWRGDAKNKQLTRIYGVAYPDKKLMKAYTERMEYAEKNNHNKLGQEMELFTHFSLIGKGLPVWLPKGEAIRQKIEDFVLETENKAGYVRVSTPHLAKKELFEASGHLPYYEDSMYPAMKMDDGTYYLKAMNCPLHHLVFGHKQKSYRDMPLRIAEYGTCYRNELSGTLSGLLRVRILRMNDAHIYCREDQIKEESKAVLKMIKDYYDIFGLKDYWFRLSLGDIKNEKKYIKNPKAWKVCEKALKEVLDELKLPYKEIPDEAAFYGPKIDIQFRNIYGREETMSTVQLDFVAKDRFNLNYKDKKGNSAEVYVIHRAPLSTHERFMAFLIETYAGKFPLWLSPLQVIILPITDKHNKYCKLMEKTFSEMGLRVEVDSRSETLNKKIRDAQLRKINYILVAGDKEMKTKSINIRTRDEKVHGTKKIGAVMKLLKKEVDSKSLNSVL